MGKYRTKYSSEWERTFDWIMKCPSDTSVAFCKTCKTTFKIDGGGISQAKSHSHSRKHVNADAALKGTSSQATFGRGNGSLELSKGKVLGVSTWEPTLLRKMSNFRSPLADEGRGNTKS